MMARLALWLLLFFLPLLGGELPAVLAIDAKEDAVTLRLSKPLLSTPKRGSVELDDKKIKKFYFDIGANLTVKPIKTATPSLADLRVAQYNPSTVRIVCTASADSKFEIKETKDSLTVALLGAKKENAPAAVKTEEPPKSEKTPPKAESRDDTEAVIRNSQKKIVIDPGHGGKDPGALGKEGAKEKDIVLSVAQKLYNMLLDEGYAVYMTRKDDIFIELQERTKFANRKNADIFISIHANAIDTKHNNASKFHGIETYFLSPARSERAKKAAEKENGVGFMDAFSKETFLNFLNREKIVASNKLAIDIHRGLLGYSRAMDRDTFDAGVKEAPFWVLVGAQMPAVLVELGYMTHPEDLAKLQNEHYQSLQAKGIMEGIENYFSNN